MIEIKRTSDIQKSQHTNNYDGMSNITKRRCKGNCVNFKAKRPANGNFYASGYSRCNVCDIFLTPEGTRDGLFCNCCNIRVRNRPRTGAGKERYFEDLKRITKSEENNSSETNSSIKSEDDENFRLEESTKERIQEELNDTKKSAPIYEEIDESVKTYYELKEFLESKIKPQANYQFVMLKELLEYGKLHKGEIAESLAYFNNKNTLDINSVKYYFDVPVYDVLLNHGFVIEDEGFLDFQYYSLNVKLEGFRKTELIYYLSNEIRKYNEEHNIPENKFPNADNMGNIDWSNFKSKSKVQKLKNFVKKMRPASANSWIWSVTPENWEIVKSKYVWGSRIPKERIGSKVQSGDQVAFYVIGTNSFKGIFAFDGNWFDSPGKLWDDDLEPDGSLRYRSRINLKLIQLGTVTVSDLYEKMDLFMGKPQNICNLLLQGGSGYPSNNSRPLLEKDFKIIKEHLSQNSSIPELNPEETVSKIVKECPKCHETKIEGFPGIKFDNKIEEFFGFRFSYLVNSHDSKKPNIVCRKCSRKTGQEYRTRIRNETYDQLKEDLISSSDIVNTRIFDFDGDTLNIKNCKILSTNTIQKDQIMTNDDLISTFKVGNMGGIRYTKENDVIVLLSTHSDDYDDSIDTDSGLIIYTGEGKDDQELKNGNEKILNSQNTPMVFFKEVYQEQGVRKRGALDNKYKFVGVVKYQKHYWKTEKDRKVVKFVLEIQS